MNYRQLGKSGLRLAVFGIAAVIVRDAVADQQSVQLHEAALNNAETMLRDGRFTADKRSAWAQHQPSRAAENEFIRAHGFEEYGKWHLAIDRSHPATTKAHYKFPFGDFHTIHRCALLAIKSRAHQYRYREIENAAQHLIDLLTTSERLGVPGAKKSINELR